MEYEEGKVYLQNIRTGDIHLYERYMAHNKNYVAVVPKPVKKVDPQSTDEAAKTGSTQQPGSA